MPRDRPRQAGGATWRPLQEAVFQRGVEWPPTCFLRQESGKSIPGTWKVVATPATHFTVQKLFTFCAVTFHGATFDILLHMSTQPAQVELKMAYIGGGSRAWALNLMNDLAL